MRIPAELPFLAVMVPALTVLPIGGEAIGQSKATCAAYMKADATYAAIPDIQDMRVLIDIEVRTRDPKRKAALKSANGQLVQRIPAEGIPSGIPGARSEEQARHARSCHGRQRSLPGANWDRKLARAVERQREIAKDEARPLDPARASTPTTGKGCHG